MSRGARRLAAGISRRRWLPRRRPGEVELPASVLHVTHYKAGSQWIYSILRDLAPELVVPPRADRGQFLVDPPRRGRIYPTLYVTREELESVDMGFPSRRFVVIRDLRDTLVSGYHSIKVSHRPFAVPEMQALRGRLQTVDLEAGLLELVREWLPLNAEIQRSWIAAGEPVVRYEDLLERDTELLEDVLVRRCGLPISSRELHGAVRRARFHNQSQGRRRGEEDIASHRRRAVPGEWREVLPGSVQRELKATWGQLLIDTGYERDESW